MSPIDPIPQPEAGEAGSPESGSPEAGSSDPGPRIEAPTDLPITADPLPLLAARANTEVDLLDVFFISVMTVASFLFLGGLAAIIFMLAHGGQNQNSKAMGEALASNAFFVVPTQLVVYLAILGFTAFLVWVRHKTSLFQAIHWNAPARRLAIIAVAGGIGLAFFSMFGEIVLNPWIPKSLPISDYFKDRPSALLLSAFGVLIAPFMEEIFFRGFLYPGLARWTGSVRSVLITAFAFALLHGAQLGYSWAPMLLIFGVGVALTMTRAATNSVATCVIVHMTYNFVLLAQSYYATHGFRQMGS